MKYAEFEGDSQHCIVLLHGLGVNKTYFGPLCRMFEGAGQSYVAIDLPGHGFARDVECASYGEIAEYVEGILDEAGIDAFIPAGFSFGGFVALAMAGRFAERAKGLALMASSYEVGIRTLRMSFVAALFPICTAVNEYAWWRNPVAKPEFDFSELAPKAGPVTMVYASSIATSKRNMRLGSGIMTRQSLRPFLDTVRAPTLIIQPRRCQFFSRRSYNALANGIPGAVRHAIYTTHNIAEDWDTVFELLRGFVAA